MTITNWLALAALMIGTVTVIAALVRLRYLSEQTAAQYRWATREAALGYSVIRNPDLRDTRKRLESAFGLLSGQGQALTLEAIDGAVQEDPTVNQDIVFLLAHLENLALAIRAHIVDEDVAFEMLGGMLVRYARLFGNWIERRRCENPRSYEYLKVLSAEWERRLADRPLPVFSPIHHP